jgi:hypothetical protein
VADFELNILTTYVGQNHIGVNTQIVRNLYLPGYQSSRAPVTMQVNISNLYAMCLRKLYGSYFIYAKGGTQS